MKKEHPETTEIKEYPPPWWYYNWVPHSYTPTKLNAEQQPTTSANDDKPEIPQQQATTDDKQKELNNKILSVLLTPSSLQPSPSATEQMIQSVKNIVKKSSKPLLLSLMAKYQKQTNVQNRKINKNIVENEQKSDS